MNRNELHPYIKSLEPYTSEDKDVFFGRDAEMEALHRLVDESQILLVYGPSGAGKTSLIQCGLSSKFSNEGWRPVFVRRDEDLLQEWAHAMGVKEDAQNLEKSIEEQVAQWIEEENCPICFVFDQFEELFISGTGEEANTFFRAVKSIRSIGTQVRFIFICREEFLANFSVAETHLPDLMAHRMRVVMMTSRQMTQVLASILQSADREFESGFLAAFESVLQTEGVGSDLAGFQVYVEYLLSEAPPEVPLTPAHIGGRNSYRRAMEMYITRQLGHLPDPDSTLQLLKMMVSIKGTKLRVHTANLLRLQRAEDGLDNVQEVLNQLVSLRLLRYLPELDAFELLHDALAKSISQKFLPLDQERLEVQEFVRLAFRRYTSQGKDLTDSDLTYITPHLGLLVLPREESEFLDRAFSLQDSRIQSRRMAKTALVVAGSSLLVLFTFLALKAQFEAAERERFSRAIELADQVLSGKMGRGEERFALASQAHELHPGSKRTFEALLSAAHHPTLDYEILSGLNLSHWTDTLLIGEGVNGPCWVQARNGELDVRSIDAVGQSPNQIWFRFARALDPLRFNKFDKTGNRTYDAQGTPLENWDNPNDVVEMIWEGEDVLMGAVFADGEFVEFTESGHIESRGTFDGDLSRVALVRFGNRVGTFPPPRKDRPADEILALDFSEKGGKIHPVFPAGTPGSCMVSPTPNHACLRYVSSTDSTSVVTLLDLDLMPVFESEVALSFNKLSRSYNCLPLISDLDEIWGFRYRNPKQLYHLGLQKPLDFNIAREKYGFSDEGDLFIVPRIAGSQPLNEVKVFNREGQEFSIEASYCWGWLPGGDVLVVGENLIQEERFELAFYNWRGEKIRSIPKHLAPGSFLQGELTPNDEGTCLISLMDERLVETHCWVINPDCEVLGAVTIPDVPSADFRASKTMALEQVGGVKGATNPIWLLNLSQGIAAITYKRQAAPRIWPVHRTHFSVDCMNRVFLEHDDGLEAFDLVDGIWKKSHFIAYPGLSDFGEIEAVHCSGDFIQLRSGDALRSESAGGLRQYRLSEMFANWSFSTANRHPVNITNENGEKVLAWIELSDSLKIDTSKLVVENWKLRGKDVYAQASRLWEDSAGVSSRFYHVDLLSGDEKHFALANKEGSQHHGSWNLEDVIDNQWVLTRSILDPSKRSSTMPGHKVVGIGPGQTILWDPLKDEILDSIQRTHSVGKNLLSAVSVFSEMGLSMVVTNWNQIWTVGSFQRFESMNVKAKLPSVLERSRMNWMNLKLDHRNGALFGMDRKTGLSFCVDETSGALLHLGSFYEVYHVIDEDYAWLEARGMFELRPRSLRALEAMMN